MKDFWQSPRWQSADKAVSVILSQQFMAVLCSRRGKWWKLTWALATPNLSPYLATGGGIIFALFPQGKTNFLVIRSSIDFIIDFMSFIHLLSTNRVMSIYETSVVRFCVLVALVHSNVKHGLYLRPSRTHAGLIRHLLMIYIRPWMIRPKLVFIPPFLEPRRNWK